MQYPAGMKFNPDTARNEMVNFWEVLFSPVAINKFLHTISSGYVVASIFVIGVSAWFLLKRRERSFAKQSMVVAAVFGLVACVFLMFTGDSSARKMAKYQPMKFAAMENLYDGRQNAPLAMIGLLQTNPLENDPKKQDFKIKIDIPNMLSYMAFLDAKAYVPGIRDLVKGNPEHNIISYKERSEKGKIAIMALAEYKNAKKAGNDSLAKAALVRFQDNYSNFGYGYYDGRDENELIPDVPSTFYSFRIMVFLGLHFIALFIVILILTLKDKIDKKRFILYTALWTIPLVFLTGMFGWTVAEAGRQPWVIQDIMPNIAAVSQLKASSVQITFVIFAIVFTGLLIAEIKIMTSQIKKGPASDESANPTTPIN
jgi:cytochrome d ubiquinol oxidase subunit I